MKKIKSYILQNKKLFLIIYFFIKIPREINLWLKTKKIFKEANKSNKIFYIGIPAHGNLGDLAQGVCIRKWIKKNYPERDLIEIETNAIVNTHFSHLNSLKKIYKPGDIIIYQSGYTTTDLGGYADEMHRAVMSILPKAKMLMMPQTIFFQKQENKERTSKIYNKMSRMLFLARDEISYKMALQMFPNISIELYPDIVTTMIGKQYFNYQREGIIMCCRNDEEKFYSDEELLILEDNCKKIGPVEKTDTTKLKNKDIIINAEKYINKEIDKYAHYKIVITDRYHGTIFSLIAGTPVIIIKTTDHKVVTGANWFKGIYDDYVYLAEDLNEAYLIARKIYNKNLTHKLEPYFEKKYYDNLKKVFEKNIGER